MSGIAANAELHPGVAMGGRARTAILAAGAMATAGTIAVFGTASIAVIACVAAAAIALAVPEAGIYILFAALALPVPVPAGPVVVYPHDAAALLVIASATISAMRRRDFHLPPVSFLAPAGAFLAAQVLSVANAPNLRDAGIEILQEVYLLLLLPAACFLVFRDERALRRAAAAFVALAAAEALLICVQFLMAQAGSYFLIDLFAFGRHTFTRGHRVFGTIGPTVGVLMVASSLLLMNLRLSWRWKAPVLLLHVFAIFATGTRSAALAFGVALLFYTIFSKRKAASLKVLAAALAAITVFVAVMGVSRFADSLVHFSDSRYRIPIDTKALRGVLDHAVIGHGPKEAAKLSISIFGAKKTSVENEFLARLYDSGAIGLAALVAFAMVPVLASVWRAGRATRAGALAATAAAAIVGIYSTGPATCIFEGDLGQWTMLLYAMMLAGSAASVAVPQEAYHA